MFVENWGTRPEGQAGPEVRALMVCLKNRKEVVWLGQTDRKMIGIKVRAAMGSLALTFFCET